MKEFWKGLKPVTRCFLIGMVTIVLIAAMYFGVIDKEVSETTVNTVK